ncbi:PHP domain-containing protein [Salipaludibacillus sp. CUR1]|uniref:PHP domain-containing protein n=1 Tax=Salipaludibacillus sp. CUR1 TaxID=2820003 RepID=UPI001E2B9081|nr:PHP domain-containing protein [Salipaludibacillus sp. CUR1]MCE7791210.1 PHP domain-containing protein [Salipaludibacillus sp. CUR1]
MVGKADLHMHSTASDGGYGAETLMEMCAEAGLSLISLTDHDTTAGVEKARKSAESLNIQLINGIELSTRSEGQSVDILGYGIDVESAHLQKTLSFHRQMREERMERMVRKCRDYGLEVTVEDVKAEVTGHTYSRPHLAKALIKKGYGEKVSDIFDQYIGYGKPCYVVKEKEMTPPEAVKLIHEAGGIAVAAHPIYYDLDDHILDWFINEGLDGIEVYHRDHDEQAVNRFSALAEKAEAKLGHRVFKTGGSDFHHEAYGREGEKLGITKLPYGEAEYLLTFLQNKEKR